MMEVPIWALFKGEIQHYGVNYIGYFARNRFELHGDDGQYESGNTNCELEDWIDVVWKITPIEIELENK